MSPRRAGRRSVLELDDIQGGVLKAYGASEVVHSFWSVTDPVAARRFLSWLSERVLPASPWTGGRPSLAVQCSFTAAGLHALGVEQTVLGGFSQPFREGMARRAVGLGDVGPSAPALWRADPARVHLLTSSWVLTAGTAVAAELAERAAAGGLERVHECHARQLTGAREQFGFADGYGQPAVEGFPGDPDEEGVPDRWGRTRPLPAGEFLLGYPDAQGCLPLAPAGPLGRNGSYVVYRELDQDVAAFRRYVAEQGRLHGREPEWVASRLVGRWSDSTPLALSPDRPDPAITSDPGRRNAYDYHDDPLGMRCPLGAHVRRVNPRAGLPFGGATVRRHRMIRRGMPYGPPLPPGTTEDDGVTRGLAFLAFNADLENQFEFVMSSWCNDGDALGLGDVGDPLIGSGIGPPRMTVPGERPVFLTELPRFVTTRFGAYLYLPGISGLRSLCVG